MARATPTPEVTRLRARVAALTRAVEDCRRQLAEVRLTQYVEQIVARWPRPSDEVIDKIAGLLRAGRSS